MIAAPVKPFPRGTLLSYGGAFNPIHHGHLKVIGRIRQAFPDNDLMVLPSCTHPLGKVILPFEHRLEMCRLAIQEVFPHDKGVILSDLERKNAEGTTADLVRLIGRPCAVVIGLDNALSIASWHKREELIFKVPFVVLPRDGREILDPDAWFLQEPNIYLDHEPTEISSTDIRGAVGGGADVSSFIPSSVREYIAAHQLYQS